MVALTVQSIFLLGYAAFEQAHALPEFIRDAAHHLMVCRTAVLGGHTQSCPDGHFHRIWYNSCKHRMCPQCAYLRIQQWLLKQKARILNCDHYHVIFTIPEDLRFLWSLNTIIMTRILFLSSRDTLFELLGDKKYLGAKPGIIASLHTWTKTLLLHPHIHCLVTGGGLTLKGEWESVSNGYLLPFDVVRDVFRRNVRDALIKASSKGNLILPKEMRHQQLINLLNKLGRKKWNVKICERYSHGNGVLTYLARYLRGGPIANSRIIKIKNNEVTLNYGREKRELMNLSITEFIRRFLKHIPLPNAILVRSYGLYSHAKKQELAECRQLLGQKPIGLPKTVDWQECFTDSKKHPENCPVCGKRLINSALIKPLPMAVYTKDPPNHQSFTQAA